MGKFILYSLAFIGLMTISAIGAAAAAVTMLWLQDRKWQLNAARNRQAKDEGVQQSSR